MTEHVGQHDGFPPEFFSRADEGGDADFYKPPRFVTHIDDTAIAVVGELYEKLGIAGHVLDLMGSWVSHFKEAPEELTVLGMNVDELHANPQATHREVKDLNEDPGLAFDDDSFDHAVCCVSVDYLVDPIAVFREVVRVVKPGGLFVCTFSNRCFATKAIRGWLLTDDEQHCDIVSEYFRRSGGWDEPAAWRCTPLDHPGDPLFAVFARAV